MFIVGLECSDALHLAVSEVCYWSLTSRFISSIEELPSNAPLLTSGFVRRRQEVKSFFPFQTLLWFQPALDMMESKCSVNSHWKRRVMKLYLSVVFSNFSVTFKQVKGIKMETNVKSWNRGCCYHPSCRDSNPRPFVGFNQCSNCWAIPTPRKGHQPPNKDAVHVSNYVCTSQRLH